MRFSTGTYAGLIEQLRMVAINSGSFEQRERMRDNMLRIIVRTFDASGAYLYQLEQDEKHMVLRHQYQSGRNNSQLEQQNRFRIGESGVFASWLCGDTGEPLVIHFHDLAENDPERKRIAKLDTMNVISGTITYNGQLWGLLEIRDSRVNRRFGTGDFRRLLHMSQCLGDTILTEEG